ncbi:glutamate racemase [Nesterenkonia sp. MY13]|uniref:Glutamate racemase n=1 Tax=Nesterenkonia sedimenti TaxID=1463632 RepID=A0A7X8YDB3_9MICC|nr:aspartate/glutamate racemase family protein [Nesterenkonia sedimenti]NLS09429.1 glutamate racemase [Nesterenkonia sedimenti]
MKIGVFDSGRGGQAVADRLAELLPQAQVVTAHDHKNVPYGSRTPEEVHRLTDRAIQPLLKDCDVVVLACNTATAAAIEQLRADYPQMPFVGLEPMVKPASSLTRSGRIVVCATPATLASPRYQRLKQTWAGELTVIEPDCSSWAATIEQGRSADLALSAVVESVETQGADVVVLACTHYHWIKDAIQAATGDHVQVLEPSDAIASQIQRVLAAAGE